MTEEVITRALTWFGQKTLKGIFNLVGTTAFLIATLAITIGYLMIVIGFKERGFRMIGLSFMFYLLVQIVLLAMEVAGY